MLSLLSWGVKLAGIFGKVPVVGAFFTPFKLIAIAVSLVTLLGGYGMFKWNQHKHHRAVVQEVRQQEEIQGLRLTLDQYKKDIRKQRSINKNLENEFNAVRQDKHVLEEKFEQLNKNNRIKELAENESEIITNKAVVASEYVWRCVEIASGSKLTEEEIKLGSEANPQCSELIQLKIQERE